MDALPEPSPAYELVIEQRLIECGLDPKGFTVTNEEMLQSIEIRIAPDAGATEGHFPCIHEAADHEIVSFEDDATHSAYSAFTAELHRPEWLASAKASLQELNLLEGFPEREAFDTVELYARALESHSGVSAGSALKVTGNSIIFSPSTRDENLMDFIEEHSKLIAVLLYINAKGDLAESFSIGFIGNEKYSETESN